MVDFFNEVDEDLRAQETRDLVRKWLPWAIGIVVALLVVFGGWWGWEAWRDSAAAKASVAYERGLKAMAAENGPAADAAFTEVAASGPSAYKALALMQRGGIALRDNKTAEAVKFFDEAAKAARSEPIIADAAALKAAYTLLDSAPYAEVEKRLLPLIEEGRPYRPLAQEALAMAKLMAGKTAEARTDLVALSVSLGTPPSLQQRAQATIQEIDSGVAGKLPAIARAAAALPPAPPAPIVTAPAAPQPAQPQAPAQAPSGAPAQ